jgi:hypothetical protein
VRVLIHQALKDVRAQRRLLAIWVGVVALDCLVYSLGLDARVTTDDVSTSSWFTMSRGMISLATGAYAWLLAVRIVHADPLDGTSAFWLTRPVTARVLLASKLALIVTLFLLLPAIAAVIIQASNGVAFGLACRSAIEWALTDAALLLPVVLVAALTRDLARVALAGCAALLIRTPGRGMGRFAAYASLELPSRGELRYSAFLAALVLFVAIAVALIAHQYVTRRSRRTLGLAAAALPAVALVFVFWPWNILPALRTGPVDRTLLDLERIGVAASFDGALSRYAPAPEGKGRVSKLYGTLDVTGVPDGWLVLPARGRGEMRFADGGSAASSEWDVSYSARYSWYSPELLWDYPDLGERLLGTKIVGRRGPLPAYKYCLFSLPEAGFREHAGHAAEYSADLTFTAYAVRIAAVLPLQAGAAATVGSVRIGVAAADRDSRGDWRVRIRTTAPRFVLPWRQPQLSLALRNPQRREALRFLRYSSDLPGVGPASVELAIGTSVVWAVRHKLWGVLDDAWLQGAELVVIQVEDKGWFTKPVSAASVVVPPLATTEFPYR